MAGDVGGKSRKGGGIVAINIIPLVDIMLVLLIIFMVTATVQSAKNVPVQMPKAASGVGGPSTAIQLSVDRMGVMIRDALKFFNPRMQTGKLDPFSRFVDQT